MSDLDEIMSFDHVVRVSDDGTVSDDVQGVYAPELLMSTDADGSILADDEADYIAQAERQGWELLKGFTRQHGYRGVGMHASEYIGGALEDHIRETPGLYVAIEIETDDDDLPDGWAVAYREYRDD